MNLESGRQKRNIYVDTSMRVHGHMCESKIPPGLTRGELNGLRGTKSKVTVQQFVFLLPFFRDSRRRICEPNNTTIDFKLYLSTGIMAN